MDKSKQHGISLSNTTELCKSSDEIFMEFMIFRENFVY